MSTALVWKNDVHRNVCTARKLNAVRGQYLIMRFRDSAKYGVWHRSLCSVTGEMPTHLVGHTDSLAAPRQSRRRMPTSMAGRSLSPDPAHNKRPPPGS
jgi:hypothetical protein